MSLICPMKHRLHTPHISHTVHTLNINHLPLSFPHMDQLIRLPTTHLYHMDPHKCRLQLLLQYLQEHR